MFYTGIGSRQTPKVVCQLMTNYASWLASKGYILRSGHAIGADQAFENGADSEAEIYLPWPGFENSTVEFVKLTKDAFDLAARFHPAWSRCYGAARSFHARNGYQVLGKTLDKPSEFICCWTKDGLASGGTGQAMRIGKFYGIEIRNLFFKTEIEKIIKCMAES